MKFKTQPVYDSNTKFRALGGLIAVRMDESLAFIGKIALPAYAREEVWTGTVVSAGPGVYNDKGKYLENPVKDNDRVIVAKNSGVTIEIQGEELIFLTANEITGIIREDV